MFNDEIRNTIIDNLESKMLNIANTIVALASQGYLVNKTKSNKLKYSGILISAFENIHILDSEQQKSIISLYNTLHK